MLIMFGYYFGQATISALLATVSYVAASMTMMANSADEGTRGIAGLQILALMGFPFLIVITLPAVLILAQFIKNKTTLLRTIYILSISIGLVMGIVVSI